MSDDSTKQITLNLDLGDDADNLETDEATTQLLSELRQLDLESVDKPPSPVPLPGAMGDLTLAGELILVLSSGAISGLVVFLTSWLERRRRDSVKITLGCGENKAELTFTRGTSPQTMEAKIQEVKKLLGDC